MMLFQECNRSVFLFYSFCTFFIKYDKMNLKDGEIFMKILNFGSCNIDLVYSLNHIVACGETETADDMNVFPGGKGLNQSIALARAGAKVYHAGCIGEDGKFLSDIMKDNGVDTTYLKQVKGKNGHAVIQVGSEGDNSIFVYSGSNSMITEEFIDSVLDNFEAGDILLIQNEINGIPSIVEKAHERKLCIVFNPSPYNEEIKKINLSYVDYLILNEIEAEMFSGIHEPEQSLQYFAENYPDMKIVLTLGKNGSVYLDKDKKIYRSAFLAKTVDTTAAGDTFTGFFIAGISEGSDCAEVLRIASAASAIAVSRQGAAPSIPSAEEVREKINSMKEYKTGENIKKILDDYIEKNLKILSLKNLSEFLGYSVTHTQNIVKKLYGKSFSKLIQDLRCEEAAKLLKESDLSVSEIITAVGYENESFFRGIFKQKYNKNMSEFRRDK